MRENIIEQKSQQDFVFVVEKLLEQKIVLDKNETWRGAELTARKKLSRSEQPVAGVAKSGKNVSGRIELAIERGRVDLNVRMRIGEPPHSFRGGDEA